MGIQIASDLYLPAAGTADDSYEVSPRDRLCWQMADGRWQMN